MLLYASQVVAEVLFADLMIFLAVYLEFAFKRFQLARLQQSSLFGIQLVDGGYSSAKFFPPSCFSIADTLQLGIATLKFVRNFIRHSFGSLRVNNRIIPNWVLSLARTSMT